MSASVSQSFVGLVGHYRHFIIGFAKIAVPLYDLTSGDNKDKKSEHVDLSPEAAPPVVPMKPLSCSGPGELLHVDFTSIEETVPFKEEPIIQNVLVLQDHFSKYVVAYVVKDQTAHTATETLRNG